MESVCIRVLFSPAHLQRVTRVFVFVPHVTRSALLTSSHASHVSDGSQERRTPTPPWRSLVWRVALALRLSGRSWMRGHRTQPKVFRTWLSWSSERQVARSGKATCDVSRKHASPCLRPVGLVDAPKTSVSERQPYTSRKDTMGMYNMLFPR